MGCVLHGRSDEAVSDIIKDGALEQRGLLLH